MSELPAVQRWLEGLPTHLSAVPMLSPAGAELGLQSAIAAINHSLSAHLEREAPAHTVFIASSTVFTTALEWCAVLLARGGRVTIKIPRGLETWYSRIVSDSGLPLFATTDRGILDSADRVVLMGADATVSQVRRAMPHPERLLAFGSRHSLAWWTDATNAPAVALDHVLYDGRGCMAPTGVFSPLPDAAEHLAFALSELRRAYPLGELHPGESAWVRERRSLAKVVGRVVDEGVIELPASFWVPRSAPGLAVVYRVERFDELPLNPEKISVLGTDAQTHPAIRCAPLGTMQQPALQRVHDGVPWLDVL